MGEALNGRRRGWGQPLSVSLVHNHFAPTGVYPKLTTNGTGRTPNAVIRRSTERPHSLSAGAKCWFVRTASQLANAECSCRVICGGGGGGGVQSKEADTLGKTEKGSFAGVHDQWNGCTQVTRGNSHKSDDMSLLQTRGRFGAAGRFFTGGGGGATIGGFGEELNGVAQQCGGKAKALNES